MALPQVGKRKMPRNKIQNPEPAPGGETELLIPSFSWKPEALSREFKIPEDFVQYYYIK